MKDIYCLLVVGMNILTLKPVRITLFYLTLSPAHISSFHVNKRYSLGISSINQ